MNVDPHRDDTPQLLLFSPKAIGDRLELPKETHDQLSLLSGGGEVVSSVVGFARESVVVVLGPTKCNTKPAAGKERVDSSWVELPPVGSPQHPGRNLLFVLQLTLIVEGEKVNRFVAIREGDDVDQVSTAFCEAHGIQTCETLTSVLRNKFEATQPLPPFDHTLLPSPTTPGDSLKLATRLVRSGNTPAALRILGLGYNRPVRHEPVPPPPLRPGWIHQFDARKLPILKRIWQVLAIVL